MADSLFSALASLLDAPMGASINVGILEGVEAALLQVEGEEGVVIPLGPALATRVRGHVHRHAMNENPWGLSARGRTTMGGSGTSSVRCGNPALTRPRAADVNICSP